MDRSKHQSNWNNNNNNNNLACDRFTKSFSFGEKPNPNSKKSRKLNKLKTNVKSKDEHIVLSKKLWGLHSSLVDEKEESLASVLIAWGREKGFYFLGMFCLLMCAFLFALQAYMALRSYQMLHQITTHRHIPETVYKIYFDGNDWALDLDKVDLRANTSLFMH